MNKINTIRKGIVLGFIEDEIKETFDTLSDSYKDSEITEYLSHIEIKINDVILESFKELGYE